MQDPNQKCRHFGISWHFMAFLHFCQKSNKISNPIFPILSDFQTFSQFLDFPIPQLQSEFWSHFFIILLLLHCSLGRSTCNSLQMPNLLRLSCQTFSFLFLGNEEMEIRFLCWSSELVFVYKGFLTREVLLVQKLPASRRKLI